MKYYGYWSANNNNSYNREPYESNNKRTLAKDMKAIAKGNTFSGNHGKWEVYAGQPDENNYQPILSGRV
jgi:hypothetical protein